jgi:hypothetical protein
MDISAEYMAGLFDGEGCLYVHEVHTKRKHGTIHHMMARAVISSTYLPLLIAVREKWGGSVHPDTQASGKRQSWRLDFNSHEELLGLLRAIQPYVIIKKDQIDFFLAEFAPTMRAGRGKHLPLSPEQHAKRAEVKAKLQELKKVDFPLPAIN